MSRRRSRGESPLLLDPSLKVNWRTRFARQWSLHSAPFWRRWYRLRSWHRRVLVAAALLMPLLFIGNAALEFRDQWSARSIPGQILLGRNAPLGGIRLFPDDNPWNTPIDDRPVSPESALQIAAIGDNTTLHPDFGTNRIGTVVYGIPYVVVDGFEVIPHAPVFQYQGESDEGHYPIPDDPPIESGGDRHLLILDRGNRQLYELYLVTRSSHGWNAVSGAVFDLGSNATRPRGWTSADAAGLPILPGLVRADEVYDLAEINHALRFTLPRTRRAFVYPARHQASHIDDPKLLPMGARLRLKADVDLAGFPPGARVVAEALKRYGMFLADNGSAMYLTGTADRRWKRADIDALKQIRTSDFEVIVPPPPPASDTTIWQERRQGLAGFSER